MENEKVATTPVIETATTAPASPVYNAAADSARNHKDRIVLFLEGKKGTVKLNDFIKSFWTPQPKILEQGWENQGNMRKLRKDLMELATEGKVKFANTLHERLGDAYWADNNPKTVYYNITNTPIEVDL